MASNRSLGSLTLDLIANIGGFTDALDKASRETNKHLDEMEKRAYEFGQELGDQIKTGLEAAGIVLGLDAIKDKLFESIKQMDEMGKAAQKVGQSVEGFSALAAAAQLANVNTDDLVETLGKLANSQGKAQDPTSTQARVFKALGIAVKDSKGNLRDANDILLDYSDSLKELGVNSTTTAAGMELFGKSYQQLIPFLKDGSEAIKENEETAKALGATVSGASSEAAAKFEDNLGKLRLASQALFNTVAQQLLPMFNEWTDDVVDLAKDQDGLTDVATGTADAIKGLTIVGLLLASTFDVIKASIKTVVAEGAAAVEQAQGIGKIVAHAATFGQVGDDFSKTWADIKAAGNAAADETAVAWDNTVKTVTARADQMGKVFDSIGVTAKKTGEAVDKATEGKGNTNNSRLKALQAALNPKAAEQAEKLADAMLALGNAVAKADESQDVTKKAYNAYADTVRNLDQLGAKAIKAGANIKQVQDLVAQGVAGAKGKLEHDLNAPLLAAQAYKDALDQQLQAQKAANDAAVTAVGIGSQQAQQQEALNKVLLDGAQAVANFTRQHADDIAQGNPQYTKELADLKQYWQDVYNVTKDGQDRLKAAQGNWLNGVNKAWQDFLTQQNNTAAIAEQLTTDFLNQGSQAFADFIDGTKSAKDALKDFINDIEKEITQAVSKQLFKQLFSSASGSGDSGGAVSGNGSGGWMQGLGNILGNLLGGGRATGGPVSSGKMYEVNELGMPEVLSVGGRDFLLMGSHNGYVSPAGRAGGGLSVTNNFSFAAPTSLTTQTQVAQRQQYEIARAQRLR